MSFLSQYSRTEPKSITRRREVEDARLLLNDRVVRDLTVNENAKWEVRTHAQQAVHATAAIARHLKQQDQVALQARRARLAMLLTYEDAQYRDELAATTESPAERAQRLVKEARRLKGEREDKRRAFAEDQLERQWKEGCDDLRTIDSQFFKQHCNTEVLKQIDDKVGRRAVQQQNKEHWANEWERERLKTCAREDAKADQRQQALIHNRRDLKHQMDTQAAKAQADFDLEQQEKAIFQRILDMDAKAAAEKAADDHARKRTKQQETVAFNENLQAEREAAYRRQREEDKRDLHEKMEEYKEDTLRVQNDKANLRRDILEFRAYLAARKKEEARMEREMERLVQEDLDRANMRRDVQWERERLARERLMRGVLETRSDQLADKARARAREEDELYMEKRAAEIEVERAHQEELRQLAEEKAACARRLRDLDSQVAINSERKRLARAELETELRAAQEAERRYQQKLDHFRVTTVEQSKRNYGIKQINNQPTGAIQNFSRP